MNVLRRIGLGIAVLLFSLGISLVALFVGLYVVFETPQPLKAALRTSGIYTLSAKDSLESNKDAASLPTADPGMQQAFESAFSPAFLQTSSEQIIDSTYNWVHGTTSSPDFSIDLAPVKDSFANNVAAYVQRKLDALPPCTQIMAPPATVDEVLNLTCRPRGIASISIADRARQEVLNSKLFSENNVISSATLKDAKGRPLSDQLSFVPVVHQYYLISLYVLPILVLLCAAAILYWSLTKRVGVKRIAWILIGVGITNVVLAIVEVWFLHAGATIFGTPVSESPVLQDKVLLVLETLATELRNWWFGFGAGYVLLGIVLFVILGFTRPKPALAMGSEHKYENPSEPSDSTKIV